MVVKSSKYLKIYSKEFTKNSKISGRIQRFYKDCRKSFEILHGLKKNYKISFEISKDFKDDYWKQERKRIHKNIKDLKNSKKSFEISKEFNDVNYTGNKR